MKWLPIEIVNHILDYTNTGLYLVYCQKNKCHMLKIDSTHGKFSSIRKLYEGIEVCARDYTNERNTQIYYNIPLRKVPSVTKNMTNIDSVNNYMSIVILETEDEIVKEHHTSTVIQTKDSTLLLN
jgi:hypothetical protein